ncbi:ABC transporter permease [Marinobacter bryozoorum]|uniref:ABC transporter permease n=1 Tax=Marinobacter bryozoorum TaxID=256324 RepID=UPI0031F3CC8D
MASAVIRPVRELWLYRGFITGTVKREFQSKYLNSLLGVAWTVIQPLAMIIVYTLIFSQIMQAKLPGVENTFGYSIYLCSGILTWGLFAEITGRAQNLFLENANLLKKLSFPWFCLPVTVVLSGCLNFLIIFALFALFLIFTGNFPGWIVLAIIPVLLLQLLFSISLGLVLGILNVFFRDVGQLFAVVLQFWFWLTPIVYPLSILPEQLQQLIHLNPLTGLMGAYQGLFVSAQVPDWSSLMPITALALLLLWASVRLYSKHAAEIVDEL